MNKVLKILLIVLSGILILMICYFNIIHFQGVLDKSEPMTREEVVSLLEKGKEYKNYYYSPENRGISGFIEKLNKDYSKTEFYIKDNIVKIKVNGTDMRWENYNTGEIISIIEENEEKKYLFISTIDKYYRDSNVENQMGFDYSLISSEDIFNTDFEYMGRRKINNRKTILVKVWNKESLKICYPIIFYIDEDTGLIMKRIDYTTMGFVKIECDRNIKLDVVSEENVERPNLEEYEILEKN